MIATGILVAISAQGFVPFTDLRPQRTAR